MMESVEAFSPYMNARVSGMRSKLFSEQHLEDLLHLDDVIKISDDLLAQFVDLASGAGQHARLGWVQGELTRRFHALNMPEGGAVDMKQLHPKRGSANAVAKQHVDPGILAKLFTARRALEGAGASRSAERLEIMAETHHVVQS